MIRKIARRFAAILCLWAGYKLFRVAIAMEGGPGSAASLLAMFAFIIVAALLFLPESLGLLSRPFTALIDGIYGTGPGKGKPPFDCRLGHGYVAQGRYDEALEEFARVMRFHPREAEPYRESIRLLLGEFGDREGAAAMLDRGLRKISSKEERAALQRLHDEGVKRLGGR